MVPEYQDPDVAKSSKGNTVCSTKSPRVRFTYWPSFTGRNYCPPSLHGNRVRNRYMASPVKRKYG